MSEGCKKPPNIQHHIKITDDRPVSAEHQTDNALDWNICEFRLIELKRGSDHEHIIAQRIASCAAQNG